MQFEGGDETSTMEEVEMDAVQYRVGVFTSFTTSIGTHEDS